MQKRVLTAMIAITCLFLILSICVLTKNSCHQSPLISPEYTVINEVQQETNSFYSNGKVNINIATAKQLQILDGIGPEIAERIVKYREENGMFQSIEDLRKVSGIGDVKFRKIEKYITVGG